MTTERWWRIKIENGRTSVVELDPRLAARAETRTWPDGTWATILQADTAADAVLVVQQRRPQCPL
jgi:uncharacterized protein YeaC (DUF1315 family)